MRSHILRHGQTDYSTKYLVNGDPSVPVELSEEGVRSCQRAWSVLPLHSMRTWIASGFPRAQQTALLLTGVPAAELVVESKLNELDYGDFEGGPFLDYGDWLDRHGACRRPPGGTESQREGIRRMLLGLRDCLALPGPRLVVGHGLLLSVLLWQQSRSEGEGMPLFFSEAPCVRPLDVPDDILSVWVAELLSDLEWEPQQDPEEGSDDAI